MAWMVKKVGVKREDGYLYYIGKTGDVMRVRMTRGRSGKAAGKPELVARAGIKKRKGFLYFLDKKGNISRAKMAQA